MKPAGVVTDVSSTVRQPGISAARVARLVKATLGAERVKNAMISVAFVGRAAMARINRHHLGHDGPTDVISFGMRREVRSAPAIGDIYICPEVARVNATRNRVPMREELARLVVHGTLHVVGYDHPQGESRMSSPMWKRQERILASID